jgi:hypothetical protein
MRHINVHMGKTFSALAIALLGVSALGAKGCDRAVVGDDGTPAGAAGDNGTGGSAPGTGGSVGKAGSPGSGGHAEAGRAGSASAGTGTGGSGTGTIICGGLAGLPCPEDHFCDYAPGDYCGAADATGECKQMPDVCADIYQPVCGCDDETYANACEANGAGIPVASEGECGGEEPVSCGGFAGDTCSDDEYCNFPLEMMCGWADGSGVCEPRPEACDTIYDPVCGCDGRTYGNSCEAAMAGSGVVSEDACEEPSGEICGGLTGAGCQDGWFCNYSIDAMCGAADQTGGCQVIPEGCTKEYVPVCGCDDKTYGNECEANAAGVAVAARGACEGEDPPPVDFCGGIAGFTCPEGEYCSFPPEAMCGQGDMTGSCAVMPDGCTAQYDPVCGCDGVTHSNSCMAANAGVSVAHDGECEAAE